MAQALRPPAEARFAHELSALAAADPGPRPPGWRLSPRAVRTFVLGDGAEVSRKFYGDDALVDRAIVTLMSQRGLLLVGEPGTAKSMLSELLAAAVSGDSTLTVQGSAGTHEDQIKYGWNYARLLNEGPSLEALVKGPLYRGLEEGRVVRFEEITRCAPEVQDTLIGIMSDKVLFVPELDGEAAHCFGQPGFNIIATANLRDRGVHEMSSALKRRFNFETVHPIPDRAAELELVLRETRAQLGEARAPAEVGEDVLRLLVTTFQDLRRGETEDGVVVERPSTVMSTAEAVSVGVSAALDAAYFGQGRLEPAHLARHLAGAIAQGQAEDHERLDAYFEQVVRRRAEESPLWRSYWEGREK
ncbi:MAG: AAA family ATPase [Myxococcales bacterium]|nr:AAA family ATPase [Myxococcales bacterium]